MTEEGDSLCEYVRQVGESTRRYAADLLAENEKVAALASSLRAEKKRLEEDLADSQFRESQTEDLRAAIDTLIGERIRLMGQLSLLRDQLGRERERKEDLAFRLAQAEESNRCFRERFDNVEQLNAHLADLYVASYRIHRSQDREDVLTAIREVIVNIMCSEEFAIFEMADDGSLRLATSLGLGPDEHAASYLSSGKIAEALAQGTIYVASQPSPATARPRAPWACIPLKIEGTTIGAIAIFGLPQHKVRPEPLDHELFALLAIHAAAALYCSDLHSRFARLRER
jgi:GAF domain